MSKDIAMQSYLLETLLNNYIRLSLNGDASFVLQKLCSTIATLSHRVVAAWPSPVRHIAACLANGAYVQQDSLPESFDIMKAMSLQPSTRQAKGIIRFVLTLAEDSNAKPSSAAESTVRRMSTNCLDSLVILRHFLGTICSYTNPTSYDVTDAPSELTASCLQALPVSRLSS